MKKLLLTAIALAMFSFFTGCFLEEVVPTGQVRFYFSGTSGTELPGVRAGDFKKEHIAAFTYTEYQDVDEGTYDIELLYNDGQWYSSGYELTIVEDGKGTVTVYSDLSMTYVDDYKSAEGNVATPAATIKLKEGATPASIDAAVK